MRSRAAHRSVLYFLSRHNDATVRSLYDLRRPAYIHVPGLSMRSSK